VEDGGKGGTTKKKKKFRDPPPPFQQSFTLFAFLVFETRGGRGGGFSLHNKIFPITLFADSIKSSQKRYVRLYKKK
jgi:hypothetical protein